MPTLAGLRRRGVPPAAIREFVRRIGVAKANSVVDAAMLDFAIREELNKTAQRRMAVLRPLKVVIENYPEGKSEELEAANHPDDAGRRHPPHPVRPRIIHRARRLHGKPAEEILPALARRRSALALRLFHHLPRSREECRRRSHRTTLRLRSGDQRRQCAGRAQGQGHAALGVGAPLRCRRGAPVQSAVQPPRAGPRQFRRADRSEFTRSRWATPASSRRWPN